MSSKRKNTPTKLPRDDVVSERPIYSNLPQDNHYTHVHDYQSPLHIAENLTNNIDSNDSDSNNSSSDRCRPKNKKQRILQSVRNSSDSDSDPESPYNTNNNLTKPGFGLHKKSMESVLRRLGSHKAEEGLSEEGYLDRCAAMSASAGAADMQLFANIQRLLADTTAKDREQQLNAMISQLQTLKESIAKDKQVRPPHTWHCIHTIYLPCGNFYLLFFT